MYAYMKMQVIACIEFYMILMTLDIVIVYDIPGFQ